MKKGNDIHILFLYFQSRGRASCKEPWPSGPNEQAAAVTQRRRTCSDALRPGPEKKHCLVMQRVFCPFALLLQ